MHRNEGIGIAAETHALLAGLGLGGERYAGGTLAAVSPITGETLAMVQESNAAGATATIEKAHSAFLEWRLTPAPKRGELLRLFGEELRAGKQALGRLVSIETGKILSEGLGEVQEMIDICDFAVGLSRQLYGLTIATERREHRMMETWHPIGVVGVISAFNFPVAVWCWNAALALVCGDSRCVEALGEDATDCLGDPGAFRARHKPVQGRRRRRACGTFSRADWRARDRRGSRRSSKGSACLGDRFYGDGSRCRT